MCPGRWRDGAVDGVVEVEDFRLDESVAEPYLLPLELLNAEDLPPRVAESTTDSGEATRGGYPLTGSWLL